MKRLQILGPGRSGPSLFRTKLFGQQPTGNRREDSNLSDCIVEPKQTLPCNLSSTHTSSHTCTPRLLPNREIHYRSSRRRRTVAAALPE